MNTSNALRANGMRARPHGFTLIELMIVVAIVGLLASVAYPSYMNQVKKSRRSDAVAALSIVQQTQERWRANNTTYAATPAALGLSATSAGGYYQIALASATGTGYILTAAAVTGNSQATDTGCATLTVTVLNGNATNTPSGCWSK